MPSTSSLADTLTDRQKNQIRELLDECAVLGATAYQLSPILSIVSLPDTQVEQAAPSVYEFHD
jgi:hypothetical protein